MSWLSKLLGTGTKGIGDLAKDIREAIKGKELDPNKQLETAERLVALQTKINEVEAGHRTMFGGRLETFYWLGYRCSSIV